MKLYPYQQQAVNFLQQNNGKAILALEQGLGKTAVTISYLKNKNEKTLVVCPAGIKFSWADEIVKWDKGKKIALHVPGCSKSAQSRMKQWNIHMFKDQPVEDWDYLIVSYASLDKFVYMKEHTAVVLDECHRLGNPDSTQAWNVGRLAAGRDTVIGLSGTPVKNRPVEFYGILNLTAPQYFSSWITFVKRYCKGKKVWINGAAQVWKATGSSKEKELNGLLKDVMLRMTKESVGLDIPPMTIKTLTFDVPSEESIIRGSLNGDAFKSLAAIRSGIATHKAQITLDELDSFAKPVIIFHHHKSFSQHFLQHQDAELINGHTTAYKRQQIVASFQKGEIPILLASTKAAAEGITLTAARTIVLAEREWTASDEEQAFARAHRIGLKEPLSVVIINGGILDRHIDNIVNQKRAMVAQIVDGKKGEKVAKMEIYSKLKEQFG